MFVEVIRMYCTFEPPPLPVRLKFVPAMVGNTFTPAEYPVPLSR